MPRRRNASPTEEDEEAEEVDELEAAEQAIKANGKGKSKRKSSSSKKSKKGKERENDDSDDAMDEDDDDNTGKKKTGKKPVLTDEEISEKAKELVRYAICNEGSRKLLKRDDINKKVLVGINPRSFAPVLVKANKMLSRTFGMELVPLFPREPDGNDETQAQSQKKKKKRTSNGGEEEEEAESSEDDANPAKKKKAKKTTTSKSATLSKATAKSYSLRSLLPANVIAKSILPSAFDPESEERHSLDLQGAIGEAAMTREGLKEYKMGKDEVLDWRRNGAEQRSCMGILNVVLALIMVNERVLTDEQLVNHLKRLDLRLDSVLPTDPSAIRPDKFTLNAFLSQLIKQGYLEKTKLANPVAAQSKGKTSTQAGGGTQATQRIRATQGRSQAAGGDGEDETQAAGNGVGGGNADEEWRWGARSFAEFGEQGIAEFMKDFFSDLANNAAAGVAAAGRGRAGANGNAGGKDRRTLEKEILKGTTGDKEGGALQNARKVAEDEEEEEED